MYLQISFMLVFAVCLAFAIVTIDKIKTGNYPRSLQVKKGSDVLATIIFLAVSIVAIVAFVIDLK